jgi:hypothetical protein
MFAGVARGFGEGFLLATPANIIKHKFKECFILLLKRILPAANVAHSFTCQ